MVADTTTAAGKNVIVRHQPLGPVLAVEPWNFPVWQCIRSAAAILFKKCAYDGHKKPSPEKAALPTSYPRQASSTEPVSPGNEPPVP
jgi:acyl-CoA reductase-like NAD-dependent aldehyde dehydrogenase